MIPLFALSPNFVETILKYSGIIGVIFIFLYLPFRDIINKRFFTSLSQKRRVFVVSLSMFLTWSTGILVIVLFFVRNGEPITNKKQNFIYSGQIVNEKGYPIPRAYAYVVLGKDTIKSLVHTGSDGNFTIKLDTAEGIKTILHYGHSDYGTNTVFRALNSSTNEQFILKQVVADVVTFSINANYSKILISDIEKATGLKYSQSNPTHKISIGYDNSGVDSFDDRYRYLGGKVQVLVDGKFCCESNQAIQATNAAGNNKNDLNTQLTKMVQDIVTKEEKEFVNKITRCFTN